MKYLFLFVLMVHKPSIFIQMICQLPIANCQLKQHLFNNSRPDFHKVYSYLGT